MDEIEVHKTLIHPSIVKYLTHFVDGNILIVLELADLGTMEKIILEKVAINNLISWISPQAFVFTCTT